MYAQLAATGMVDRRVKQQDRALGGRLLAVAGTVLSAWLDGAAQAASAWTATPAVRTLHTLHGRGVSRGCATGPARLVRCEDDMERFEPGEVLVAEHGSIAALACLPVAAAVVLEVGGELSAAAIQARELGIPAVFAVPEAMSRIRSGAWLTVDGDRGTVTVTAGW